MGTINHQELDSKSKWKSFYETFIKVRIYNLALMGILLGLFLLIKYVCFIIFKGPLNFGVDLLFWIISGILFGPIHGPLFSILCDFVMTTFTSGIAFWMIEYAIIPPLVSLVSYFYLKLYREKSKWTIVISISTIIIMLLASVVIFWFQLMKDNFKYEGIKKIASWAAYLLISFLVVSITSFLVYCMWMYHKKSEWKYIEWLYYLSLIILIIVIFRWVWGPYAYIAYAHRFFSKNIDFSKQYPLTLFGIVTKSCLTIPIATIIMVPLLNIIKKTKNNDLRFNKYY